MNYLNAWEHHAPKRPDDRVWNASYCTKSQQVTHSRPNTPFFSLNRTNTITYQ
ncbi:MAG TPA: hypothetical protein VED59_05175 [Acidimicrobiales bacterium]|nr:hypothetical protein [Acidimicrobiales bacterium]